MLVGLGDTALFATQPICHGWKIMADFEIGLVTGPKANYTYYGRAITATACFNVDLDLEVLLQCA